MRGASWMITALCGAFAEGTQVGQPISLTSSTMPATTSAFLAAPIQPAGTGIRARSLHGSVSERRGRQRSSSSSSSSGNDSGAADAESFTCNRRLVRARSLGTISLAACPHEADPPATTAGLRRRRRHPFSADSKQAASVPAAITSVARRRRKSRGSLRMASSNGGDNRLPSSSSSSSSSVFLSATPSKRRAFAAAVCTRGGGSPSSSDSNSNNKNDDDLDIVRPVVAAAVDSFTGGDERKKKLVIDRVEDAIESTWNVLVRVTVPTFHLARFCFGLCLLFYGMAFRTFAFHVIVFRLAGLNQVQRAVGQLLSNYREARRTIRDAANKAETVGERVIKGDKLQEAREKMIKEKQRLLADGYLSEEETRYFMRKYKAELLKIKEEQEFFQSARSSVVSVRRSVDPKQAKSSIGGVYNALVTSFTASTIQTAGQLTLGLHMGSLLKTHILDLFGPILDPIGYRLDLATYYKKEDIPYMGKANAMDGPQNLALNVFCYSAVFAVFQVHPSVALKISMVYYGARVVTDYIVLATEAVRRKFKVMTIVHTPWSAAIHAGLTVLGFIHHREILFTAGVTGLHPLAVGPGFVGLVEPLVRFAVLLSEMLSKIDFFSCTFVNDPAKVVKDIASAVKDK